MLKYYRVDANKEMKNTFKIMLKYSSVCDYIFPVVSMFITYLHM